MSQKLDASDLGLAEGETALQPLANAVEDFRRSYIDRALAHFSGNRTQTARALGVDVRTIFRYLEKK
jgi:DNA-binding NtrC family response regulator